jgi:tRNA1Val (adenine37-N6)-methyltransferase
MGQVFRFKQFSVADDRCTMKVGTDAVLLGAWVEVKGARMILDIGSGSGVIGLMLAQRSEPNAMIHCVEMSSHDALQSKENIEASPWPDKLVVHLTPIQEFENVEQFDLIITNPPFFNKSLLPPSAQRTFARHTNSLSHAELLFSISRLLAPNGRFAVVLPTTEGNEFKDLAENSGYYCIRSLAFFTRNGKRQKRWLFLFTREAIPPHEESLTLYANGERWSNEYRDLTIDFYLDERSFTNE